MISDRQIKVIHFVESWLPQTTVWLYNQIKFLPADVQNFIISQSTQNLDQFRLPNISAWEESSAVRKFVQKVCFKLHLTDPLKLHIGLADRVIRREQPHILHSHFGHFGWVNMKLAKKHGLSHVVHFYGADVNYLPRQDTRWLDRYRTMSELADLILCEGPFMAKSISDLGLPEKKIRVHRIGIDLDTVRFETRTFRQGELLRFLIAASFREKKGIPYALEALGLYQKINSNIEISIIGDAGGMPSEKMEKQKILDTIRKVGLENKVRLLGYKSHEVLLKEAYQHHIFLSPSVTSADGDTEGGAPVTIIEMAASGMPVVSTKHCDIPFVLSAANAPYLVEERDPEALCQAIVRLFDSDWASLVKTNRDFVEGNLDTRKQGMKLATLYGEVLDN